MRAKTFERANQSMPALRPCPSTTVFLPADLDSQLNAQAFSKIFPRPHKSIPKSWLNSPWLPDQHYALLES